jgi:hypothetical protein
MDHFYTLLEMNFLTKYQICIDIQSEHNYVMLLGVIQCFNYIFQPLYLAIIRFVLSLQSNHTAVQTTFS